MERGKDEQEEEEIYVIWRGIRVDFIPKFATNINFTFTVHMKDLKYSGEIDVLIVAMDVPTHEHGGATA